MKNLLVVFATLSLFSCQSDGDWAELFDGKSLNGWHAYGVTEGFNGWYVEQGVIAFDPSKRTEARNSSLVSDQEYTDFELSLEWIISKNGNSGVFWSVIEDEQYEHAYTTGPEVQILDDNYTEYIDQRGNKNRAGALYGMIAPSEIVSNPANQWNHFLIHVDQTKNEGFIEFNGTEVSRFPVNGPDWDAMVANSGFADWPAFGKSPTGRIALQDWGGRVAFRNIKIRELNQ
ncbi:MAG: DUF1080 domain-containing protein [Bacteroidota bacterium]